MFHWFLEKAVESLLSLPVGTESETRDFVVILVNSQV